MTLRFPLSCHWSLFSSLFPRGTLAIHSTMAYRATLLAVLAAVASLAAADSGGDGTFSKVLLSNAVQTHNARCLDGR